MAFPEKLTSVAIKVAANVYFDGAVVSRSVELPDGAKKTLGFMQRGQYEFNTRQAELMDIVSGSVEVMIPGADGPIRAVGGESFHVPADVEFAITVNEPTDYVCSFLPD
ncbi:hypothetical protein Pla175_11420 [Pirellulimonas nuda]|uniref:Pyrimidine/purine nucleoside phosphorylase n=1 Tax=Pirellulimonas nuda TaxID=2528009 RepID=A0A518D8G9_9BACT|nr:pyrimidine/purine nucleoside phosphorylase [Pirellulimonas nuda]QDU87776.1 hypothetical protein Pla175_11420 [Pirellulimonas nuda]